MRDRSVRQVRSQKGCGKGLGLRLPHECLRVFGGLRVRARWYGLEIWGVGGLAWSEDSCKEVLL